jgi:hypothetical protein
MRKVKHLGKLEQLVDFIEIKLRLRKSLIKTMISLIKIKIKALQILVVCQWDAFIIVIYKIVKLVNVTKYTTIKL